MGITIRYRASRERWVVTEVNQGQRHQLTFKDEGEAKEYAAKRTAELNEAEFHGVRMGRRPKRTFLEGLEKWIEEYDIGSQINSIRPVARYMGESVVLGQATVDKARKMAADLKAEGRAQSTINNRLQVVKRVLNLAYREWDWLDQPLGDRIKKPSPKNERHVYLTADELVVLLETIPDSREVDRRIITLAMLTGLRQGELLNLTPENVSRGRILLRPSDTKSGKARIVPVPQDAQELLDELPFPTTYHRLRKTWEKARAAVGRPDLRFHDLRHSYASLLANAGENMVTVRDLMGHSSLTVTSRYAHMFEGGLDDIAARLPATKLRPRRRDQEGDER